MRRVVGWLALAAAALAAERYGSLSRQDRRRVKQRYAANPNRPAGDAAAAAPPPRGTKPAKPKRRRRKRAADDDGDAGAAPDDRCESRQKTGLKRTGPRGAPLAWSAAGAPSAAGLECVAAPHPGGGPARACCRPTAALIADYVARWGRHTARVARPAAAAEGVAVRAALEAWRCAPSLVIIGAQKAGSTALTGHLARRDDVAFGRSKELHFFDKNESQCLGPLPYLLKFPPMDARVVTAEATPFYLADANACGRIADQLGRFPPPGVRSLGAVGRDHRGRVGPRSSSRSSASPSRARTPSTK